MMLPAHPESSDLDISCCYLNSLELYESDIVSFNLFSLSLFLFSLFSAPFSLSLYHLPVSSPTGKDKQTLF